MCYPEEYSVQEYRICFDRMNPKGAYGSFQDHDVYVDSFSGTEVKYGETWYCSLVKREGIYGNYYYFAWPNYQVGDRVEKHINPMIPEIKESGSTADAPNAESVNAIETVGSEEELMKTLAGFVAIGNDTIYSPRLTAARYTVYKSFNGERLEIIPDPNGNIPCFSNSIALESLDDILDCEFPIRLDSVMKDDRIILNLTQ